MGNGALDINPPAGNAVEHLTVNGSDWLWAVTAIFTFAFLIFAGLTFFAKAGEKIFHYLFTVATLVGAISYFAIASDLGYSVVAQSNNYDTEGETRQVFFANYIYWVVSFPTLVLALGLLSGVSWATIVYHIFLAWIWIVGYLVSAYTTTNYKWGFYVFATVAWGMLACGTLREGMSAAKRVGVAQRDHTILAGWVNLLWLIYPIAVGVADGGNKIGVVGAEIFYGVLDILLVPCVGALFLVLANRWDYNRLNIAFTQYGRVNAQPGTFPEKETAPAAAGAGGVVAPGEQAV